MSGPVHQTTRLPPVFGKRRGPPAASRSFAPAPRPDRDAPTVALDGKRVIAGSFAVIARNGVMFLALIAAAAVPNRILYHVLDAENAAMAVLYFGSTLLVLPPLYGAVFAGAIASLRDEKPDFASCLRTGLAQPVAAAVVCFLTALSVWLLLIVPGYPLAARWALAAPAAIQERLGFRAALARSAALTARHHSAVRALVLMLAGFALLRAFGMGPIWNIPPEGVLIFMLGNWLFPLLLTAFTAAASAVLYDALTRGVTALEQIADPAAIVMAGTPQDERAAL